MTEEPKGERIAKVMARAGLCSRREAERWIADARVAVNGTILDAPGVTVTDDDVVEVDGKALPKKDIARLWRYHKPVGLVTSHNDEQGRETVFEKVARQGLPRVISVGRLDLNSEGLLLMTNDGEIARQLEHPSRGWTRRYRVRVHGELNKERLEGLKNGITIGGVHYESVDVVVDKEGTSNSWLTVTLTEGKNREIRRIMEHLGLAVNRLLRVSYGPFQLGTLPRGQVVEVPQKTLRAQLGLDKSRKEQTGWAKAKPKTKLRPRKKADNRSEATKAKSGANKGPAKK